MAFHLLFLVFWSQLLGWAGIGHGVISEHAAPKRLDAGQDATLSWTIYKDDIRGFSRLQLRFPDNMEVSALETAGAEFTFRDGVAKLQWRDTPASPSFSVRFKIRALDQFAGGVIEPIWSFIDAGERVDLPLDPVVIEGSPNRLAGQGGAATDEPRISARIPAPIRVLRSIVPEGPDVATIRLRVTGHPQGAFLKIDEKIPADCIVETDLLAGATASWVDGVLKFVWFASPGRESFEVSYRILGPRTRWEKDLAGDYTYLLNNLAQTGAIQSASAAAPIANGTGAPAASKAVLPEQPVLAAAGPSAKSSPAPKAAAAAPKAAPAAKPSAAPKPAPAAKPAAKPAARPVQVPAPERGVAFRVQVLAAHRQVGESYFQGRYGFGPRIDAESHEGWIKYTTGSHSAYAQARDSREQIRASHDFPGPFVTAYLDGRRITVQEALTISAQQWIP
ncbi:MAG: hypothetical protein RJA19_551 [Bacteroidota bacterium]|jgi:cell division septation protein DedD